MLKVKFTCDWCDDLSLSQRFIKCYTSSLFEINFNVTVEDDYDILVSINKPVYDRYNNRKYIGVLMEPSWFLGEYKKSEIYDTNDYVISYTEESKYKNNIFYPGVLPFHVTYETGPGLDYYIHKDFKKDKLCSIIVSRNKTSYNSDVLYNARVRLVEEILKTDLPIDIFGKGWDNFTGVDNRIKGSLDLEEKYKGLEGYRYSICIENCTEDYYFTEKITDCLLTNTIPIYYGCRYIKDFFKSPIIINNIKAEDAVSQIDSILKRGEMKQFYTEDKLLIAKKFNLFVAITKLITHYSK